MIIQGHRGGFSPDNSLEGFQCALDNNVQSVELDVSISMCLANFSLSQVWLTKDKELVVLHGGDSGELAEGSVFGMTLEEVRATESAFVVPTLREVFELIDKRIFINIEMKTPWLKAARNVYNLEEAAKEVHQLIF